MEQEKLQWFPQKYLKRYLKEKEFYKYFNLRDTAFSCYIHYT